MPALSGQTVILTRPQAQAASLASALRRAGARVVLAPVIKIRPPASWANTDKAIKNIDLFDSLIFTSSNGVNMFLQRARHLRRRLPPTLRLFAVGPKTAESLTRRGYKVATLAENFNGAALARHLGRLTGRRILVARAAVAGSALPRILRKAGAKVTLVPTYRTVVDPRGISTLRKVARRGGAQWITFTSASTVQHTVAGLGNEAEGFLHRMRTASIGPITSQALRKKGITPAVEAPKATATALAQALIEKGRRVPAPQLKRVLAKAIKAAGALAKQRFGKVALRYKGRANIVTAADLACEEKILKIILQAFPNHDFLAEERPARRSGSPYTWIIDPIDGTTNYAHSFPVCAVSIAVLEYGRPVVGGVFDPFRDELFLAERNKGATLNGKRIRVSKIPKVSESLLLTGFAYDRNQHADYLLRFYKAFMQRSHDVRRSGSAALDMAWTACGRVEGYWEFHLSPWDVAAGKLLVEEAGGQVTNFRGTPWACPYEYGRQTLASNGKVHREMLRTIAKLLAARDR